MKYIFKTLLSVIVVFTLICSVFTFTASAASVTVSGGNYNVGQTIKVTVRFNADATLYAVEADISYNASVLRLDSVSGCDYSGKNGKVKLVDDGFSATNPSKSSSYTLNFTAIDEGKSTVSVSVLGGGMATSRASGSATINVTKPAPSSNANLASLKVSGAELLPAFSAKTTSYTATVKYPVDKVTVSANVADGGATCVGAGTYDLQVGENTRIVTVTAPSGTKKAYTVVIKRLNEDETAALIEQERAADPTLVVIDGKDYHIKADLADVALPEGFTATTTSYKEGQLAAITDVANKYTLCYITADDGSHADWAVADESGEFVFLNYVSVSNKMYIIEDAQPSFTIPSSYEEADYEAVSGKVKAFKSIHKELSDFYIFNCYVDGENAFYRYDTAKNTIQRAPDFELAASIEAAAKAEQNKNIFTRFLAMSTAGKTIILLVCVAVIVLIVLVVLFIIKIINRPEKPMEFVPISGDNEVSSSSKDDPFDIFSITENGEITESSGNATDIPDEPTEDDDF